MSTPSGTPPKASPRPIQKPNAGWWDANRPRRLAGLEKYVNHQVQINLTGWKEEVDQAINRAAAPAEPESRIYWYIALAGNLLWAATCLLDPPAAIGEAAAVAARVEAFDFFTPPEFGAKAREAERAFEAELSKVAKAAAAGQQRVINTMSFAGAAVGSGVIEQGMQLVREKFPGRDVGRLTPEDGKDLVRDVAGRKRDELEEIYKAMRGTWALQLDVIAWLAKECSRDQEPLGVYDQYVWMLMFPRIDYDENRFNTIRHMALKKVEATLADFNRQWKKWQTDRMVPRYNQAYALWAMGTLAIPRDTFEVELKISLD